MSPTGGQAVGLVGPAVPLGNGVKGPFNEGTMEAVGSPQQR